MAGSLIFRTLPRLRFLLAWGAYRKGDVIQPPSAMERDALLRTVWYGRRVVELIPEEPPAPPTPAPAPTSPPAPSAEGAAATTVDPPSEVLPPDPRPASPWRGRKQKG